MFTGTPDPIAFAIGPLSIGWYGLGYAVGLAAAYLLLTWLARRCPPSARTRLAWLA